MHGTGAYRPVFASWEERLKNSRFNPLGMRSTKVADGVEEVRFSASDEEANAVSEGTRPTDWLFWKLNLKCLLSQAFTDKISEYRARQAAQLMEEDVQRLKKDADKLETELSDVETRLSFVESEAEVFLSADRSYQRKNTAKESKLRRDMNRLVTEKNMVSRRLKDVERREKQCRVALENLRGPVETHAADIHKLLSEISGMKSSRERDTTKIRDFFANMFENKTMKESDSFLPEEQVDYYYYEGDTGSNVMDAQPYNQFRERFLTAELEEARAVEEEEEEEEEEIVLKPAVPVPVT